MCIKKLLLLVLMMTLLVPTVLGWNITFPEKGGRYPSTNQTIIFVNPHNYFDCNYTLNGFIPLPCSFNQTNISSFFGWNTLEVCANNGTNSSCITTNYWTDKNNKSVVDYAPFLILFLLGLYCCYLGLRMGFVGVIGSVLLFLSALNSLAMGTVFLFYVVFALALCNLVGVFVWGGTL